MIIRHIVQQMGMRGATRGARIFGKELWLVFLCPVLFSSLCFAIGQEQYVDSNSSKGGFCIAQKNDVAGIYIDSNDYAGVMICRRILIVSRGKQRK